MTLEKLLSWGKDTLKFAGISEWKLDAWYLLEYVVGCTRNEYFLFPEQEVSDSKRHHYEELIKKRSSHIPLQYLTGSQEFMGLSFYVNESVLIPRQDTEILVEEALQYIHGNMRILDMCTGSGCILLSILKWKPEVCGVGADLSEKALEVARENQKRLQIDAEFIQSNLFENISGKFDIILSNPPYIPSQTIDTLMEEVKNYEPRMALDGHEDGLYFYRKLTASSLEFLNLGGMLFLEIGYDQAEAVTALMKPIFTNIKVVKDLAGHDRVIYGTL